MDRNDRAALSRLYDKLLEAQDLMEELQEDVQELPGGALTEEDSRAYLRALSQCEETLESLCDALDDLGEE